jgi:hypothetical protein
MRRPKGLATGVLCTHIKAIADIDSPGVDGREWRVLPPAASSEAAICPIVC